MGVEAVSASEPQQPQLPLLSSPPKATTQCAVCAAQKPDCSIVQCTIRDYSSVAVRPRSHRASGALFPSPANTVVAKNFSRQGLFFTSNKKPVRREDNSRVSLSLGLIP